MADYKTVNLKPETKQKLDILKAKKQYKSIDELINEEIDFSQI